MINAKGNQEINFYHGTSDTLNVKNIILPPITTGIQREQWRKKILSKVFFTNSLISANMYAKKACAKYGGNPIVYRVKPLGEIWNTNNSEFVADKAIVLHNK